MTKRNDIDECTARIDSELDKVARLKSALKSTQEALTDATQDDATRISRLIVEATNLFSGDLAKGVLWLHTPAQSLSGTTPISMINGDDEFIQVMDVIGRLKHGLPQ